LVSLVDGPKPKAFAHALAELFRSSGVMWSQRSSMRRREIGAAGTVPSKPAEENAAQREQTKRLPEGDLSPSEKRRQQPIPQMQHDFAADGDKYGNRDNRQRSKSKSFSSIFYSCLVPHAFVNSS